MLKDLPPHGGTPVGGPPVGGPVAGIKYLKQ